MHRRVGNERQISVDLNHEIFLRRGTFGFAAVVERRRRIAILRAFRLDHVPFINANQNRFAGFVRVTGDFGVLLGHAAAIEY